MKNNFAFFKKNEELVYLDSAATTQKPQVVIDSIIDTYTSYNANVHRSAYPLSAKITQKYEDVRSIITQAFSVPSSHSVIFTSGCTHGFNLLSHSLKSVIKGSKIILSELEHHANIVPWQELAKKLNLTIEYMPLTKDYMLDMNKAKELITQDAAIVSVTQLSNVLGTIVDVKTICSLAKKANAVSIIDGAQGAAHLETSITTIDCDFYVASSHKLYGPTGAGFIIGKTDLLTDMEPFMTGGNMIQTVEKNESTWNTVPFKFEAGTPPIAQIIGMGEAILFLQKNKTNIFSKEKELTHYTKEQLRDIVSIIEPENHESIISFTSKSSTHDIVTLLGEKNICVRGGHHCCMPLLKALGVSSTIRVSIGAYTTKTDIDIFVKSLKEITQLFEN
jgi:cysteine desulfurase/selenocysteine lyase